MHVLTETYFSLEKQIKKLVIDLQFLIVGKGRLSRITHGSTKMLSLLALYGAPRNSDIGAVSTTHLNARCRRCSKRHLK